MTVDVLLPPIGDAKTEAKLAVWLKRAGESVTAGEPIAEIETEKTTVEIEAPISGILREIRVAAGSEGIAVGSVLAIVDDTPVADTAARQTADVMSGTAARAVATPQAVSVEKSAGVLRSEPPPLPLSTEPTLSYHGSRKATPLAAKMAKLAGLDLSTIVAASDARIMKADVEKALGRSRASVRERIPVLQAPPVHASRVEPASAGSSFEDKPLTSIRRVTASRLQQAKQTVPHFYLQTDCRVDALIAMREQVNARGTHIKITFTDLIVFAATQALAKVPLANAAWMESALRVYHDIDIAVAVNTAKGLMTPVIRQCQTKLLPVISQELAALAERARAGGLTPAEYTGGTFTISNLGMFGVTSITPIVNPPQACILGVGAIEARALVERGAVVPGRTISCTLAADHRAIDGATGAELLGEIRRLLEDPVSLALHL